MADDYSPDERQSDSLLPPSDWKPRTAATLMLGSVGFGVVAIIAVGFATEEIGKFGARTLESVGSKLPFGT